ncbi:MAG TPA: lactoylglutathione lyase [Rubrivivax sp.]|nr:lactoylglutathione lyase [Rubrivivax sp.]
MKYLHTMVRVTDIEASLRFYRDALGLQVLSRRDHEQGRYTLVFLCAPGDSTAQVELTYNWPAADGTAETYTGGRNFGHLAYAVDDIYATCQRLAEHGVTINRPPRDGRMAFVRSPDGISVELLQAGGARPAAEPWASMPNTGSW